MKKKYAGSSPEQTYSKATSSNLFLNRRGHENEYDIKYLNKISDYYKDMGMIEEQNNERILKSFVSEAIEKRSEGEELLREYVRELTINVNNIRTYAADNGLLTTLQWPNQKQIDEEWNLMRSYVNHPYLLNESSRTRAEFLIEQAFGKFVEFIKGAGAKVTSVADYIAKKGKEYGDRVVQFAKKAGEFTAKVFIKVIEAIPGGKTVYEFITWAGGKLVDKLKEIGKAIGDKIKEWFKTAKKRLVDIVLNSAFKDDPKFRADVYAAMGITEEDVCLAQAECRRLGITNVDLLNEWIEAGRSPITERAFRSKRLKILSEQSKAMCAKFDQATADEKKLAKTTIEKALDLDGQEEEIQDAAKAVGFLSDSGANDVDPEKLLRGRASKVVDEIMEVWSKLAEKDPKKYVKPLAENDFWEPFKTGFGLASSAMMGILALSDTAWEQMVELIDKIKEGIGIGNKDAMDEEEMMQTKSGSLFSNPKTLGPLLKGIVEGSNIEVVIRALTGDPRMIVEASKRIVTTIVTAIRSKIKERRKDVEAEAQKELQSAGEGAVIDDETSDAAKAAAAEDAKGVADAIEGFFDDGIGF